MQLFIKLYNDKPSRIGVAFPTEYQGAKAYQQLLANHSGERFNARFELSYGRINLRLISLTGSGHVDYKGLEFKAEHLQKFQAYHKPGAPIDFVHLFWKENALFIAKPRYQKPEFIRISSCEVLSPGTFGT
ncbi:MAG: hypothetical protein ACXVPQ_13370 [Bacteroidia bacterium]